MTDEEIRIVRKVRHDISRECGHDLDKVVAYYRGIEEELKRAGTFRFSGGAASGETRSETADHLPSDAVGA